MAYILENRQVPVWGEFDVIVCGGGVSGLAAAAAAARNGASVLLLEKSIQLGGLATLGLISWFEPLCDGRGKRIVGGIPKEMFDLCVDCGIHSLDPKWISQPDGNDSTQRCSTHFSHSMFALVLDRWLLETGVQVLFDTVVTAADLQEDRIQGIFVENKDGRGYYRASMVVDATGDADIAKFCGIECEDGINYLTHIAYYTSLQHAATAAKQENMLYARSWRNSGADLWGKGHPEDQPLYIGINAKEQTRFVLEGRKRLLTTLQAVPAQQRDLYCLPGMAQYRKSRRILGEYTLTEADCGKRFEDAIGIVGDFARPGDVYELPYRTLDHRSVANLYVTGRCISSTGWAWDVTRVIPAAAATGQAAGLACVLCVRENCQNSSLPVAALQQMLKNAGVRLHINEE